MKALILAVLIAGSTMQGSEALAFQKNWTVDCSSAAKLKEVLSKTFKEKVVAEIVNEMYTVQVWENRRDAGTWSMVTLDIYGYACLVLSGKGRWKFPLR